jgi:hypothetical protein
MNMDIDLSYVDPMNYFIGSTTYQETYISNDVQMEDVQLDDEMKIDR